MSPLLALFATLALVAYTASAHKYCCTPERLSAQTLVKTYREGAFYKGNGEVYYDFAAGMQAAFINITIDEYKGIFSLVSTHLDLNSGMVYTMTGGVCTKESIKESWLKESDQPHCIPETSKLDSNFVLGGLHEDLELNRYIQHMGNVERQMIVTNHHCYPVQEIFFIRDNTHKLSNVKDSTMTTVINLKLSIDDPAVFTLPSICDKAVLSTTRSNNKNLPADPWKFVPFLAGL